MLPISTNISYLSPDVLPIFELTGCIKSNKIVVRAVAVCFLMFF